MKKKVIARRIRMKGWAIRHGNEKDRAYVDHTGAWQVYHTEESAKRMRREWSWNGVAEIVPVEIRELTPKPRGAGRKAK